MFLITEMYVKLCCAQSSNCSSCERVISLRVSSPFGASEASLAIERRSREGPRKGELATISHKISFVLRPDEGKYHWLKNDVPEIKVDW